MEPENPDPAMVEGLFGLQPLERVRGRGRPAHAWDRQISVRICNLFACKHTVEMVAKVIGISQSARRVADNNQAVVNAVRSRVGALNMMSRGTSRYSSCKNFVANGDAAANENSYDPADNHVLELHMYFDPDNSGQNANCAAPGDDGFNLMLPATNWFIENYATTKLRGYVGEMGAATYTIPGAEPCKTIIERAYAGLLAHPEAWYGSATWASGIRQTDHFNLEPVAGFTPPIVDAPSFVVLKQSLLQYQV